MDWYPLFLGLSIFALRVVDVSLGTLRTISIVNGRLKLSFILGFIEVGIWIAVISAILREIEQSPWLGLFYALGFSTGNVVGILIEAWLPIGNVTLRLVVGPEHLDLADVLRDRGFAVTTFQGEGRAGPRWLLYAFFQKRRLKQALRLLSGREGVFYTIDQGGSADHMFDGLAVPVTGWRSRNKKK